MKQCKWKNYVMCVCAVGGVMFISPTGTARAAVHQPTMSSQQQLPQTKRIFQQSSSDGKINNRQINDVKWHQNSIGHILVDSFQFPNIDGYKDDTDWLKMGINRYETPNVPVVVYHLNYYSLQEKDHHVNDGWIDLVDENGTVLERHVFTIPDGKGMEVELNAPEKMQFKQAQDSRMYLHSSYRFKKSIVVTPQSQEDQSVNNDSQAQNPQPSHYQDASTDASDLLNVHDEGTNTEAKDSVEVSTDTDELIQQETKDKTTNTEMSTAKDSSTSTEDLHDQVDVSTETADHQPSTTSEGTNTDSSAVQTTEKGTATETQASTSEESTDTDDLQPPIKSQDQATSTDDLHGATEFHDSGTMTDQVDLADASTDTQELNHLPEQKDESVSTNDLSNGEEVSTDTNDLTTEVDESTETNDLIEPTVTADSATQTDPQVAPIDQKSFTDDIHDLTNIASHDLPVADEAIQNNRIDQHDDLPNKDQESRSTPVHDVKAPSEEDLKNLAKENYPLSPMEKSQNTDVDASNSRLPQTGDHVSKMLIAIGIAIICLLGLFKPRGSRQK